ncbi:MAG: hypothetical protein Unbinned7913contig1002_4 [Prokaryotic dsDNA virus sp.]|jgi:hypothetical protein|nr:MAG: hypothetical protein Unbinned7913contig1002_4 [Prokaryotic dsDNA virus sp.]|tara:strand:+ start:5858 stop:6085 length:228 start_codon:yes stop_codon:yes gene_type:complete
MEQPKRKKTIDLKGFADEVLSVVWDGNDIDGGSMQDIAERFGLIEKVIATEPCCEDCICAEVMEFPAECYRKTYK